MCLTLLYFVLCTQIYLFPSAGAERNALPIEQELNTSCPPLLGTKTLRIVELAGAMKNSFVKAVLLVRISPEVVQECPQKMFHS